MNDTQTSARERLEAYMARESDKDAAEYRRLLDAYRAEVLHEAAGALASPIPEGADCDDWADLIGSIEEIRSMAEEAERSATPGMHPKDFLSLFFDIKETPRAS